MRCLNTPRARCRVWKLKLFAVFPKKAEQSIIKVEKKEHMKLICVSMLCFCPDLPPSIRELAILFPSLSLFIWRILSPAESEAG